MSNPCDLLARWFQPVEYVECSEVCKNILSARMEEGTLPRGEIYDDVKVYYPTSKAAREAEAITAGFPCQAISHKLFRFCDSELCNPIPKPNTHDCFLVLVVCEFGAGCISGRATGWIKR